MPACNAKMVERDKVKAKVNIPGNNKPKKKADE